MPSEQRGLWCASCRRRPVDPPWRPFCSERCKLQDLAAWAEGAYRVADERVIEHDATTHNDLKDSSR